MAWIILAVAGLLEVVWATAMKYSNGFTILGPSVLAGVTAISSFLMLAVAMRTLPLGTSYMIWAGIGAVGAFVMGVILHDEAVTLQRVGAATLVVAGMVLLKAAE